MVDSNTDLAFNSYLRLHTSYKPCCHLYFILKSYLFLHFYHKNFQLILYMYVNREVQTLIESHVDACQRSGLLQAPHIHTCSKVFCLASKSDNRFVQSVRCSLKSVLSSTFRSGCSTDVPDNVNTHDCMRLFRNLTSLATARVLL